MTQTTDIHYLMDMNDMRLTLLRAQAALNVLPDTPAAIACYLADFGVVGAPGSVLAGPLTMYLKAATDSDVDVRSSAAEWGNSRWAFTLRLPQAVRAFLDDFGEGFYDYLAGSPSSGSVTMIAEDELVGLAPEVV